MVIIDINELNLKQKSFAKGNFSNIHIVTLGNSEYCLKIFYPLDIYENDIIENIGILTDIKFSNEFITPQYLVSKHNRIIGYLTKYNENIKNINEENITYEDKIKLLKNSKKIIQKLHNNYNIIHGDLNTQNILMDKDLKSYLIDFDASLKFKQQVKSQTTFPYSTLNYMKHYIYDYRADIYKFNITTLKLLHDIKSEDNLFFLIKTDMFNYDKDVKKLSKELLLEPENNKKQYSGEYIIDYIK